MRKQQISITTKGLFFLQFLMDPRDYFLDESTLDLLIGQSWNGYLHFSQKKILLG
jgi:hypothetical protein